MTSSIQATTGGFHTDGIDPITLTAWQCVIPCEVTYSGRRVNFIVPKQGYIFHSCKEIFPRLIDGELPSEGFFYFSCKVRTSPAGAGGVASPAGSATRRGGGGAAAESDRDIFVPMQYPMCVVFDILTALAPPKADLLADRALKLSLHIAQDFSEVPPLNVLHLPFALLEKQTELEISQRHKMACMLRFGTLKPRYELDTASIKELNESIRTNDCRQYYRIHSKIVMSGQRLLDDNNSDRFVAPFVFHVRHENSTTGSFVTPVVRKVPFLRYSTLGFALREYFPCCYELTDAQCTSSEPAPASMASVLVMGAQPSLGTPISFLMEHLTCVDMFVHVVVVPRQSNALRRRPVAAPAAGDDIQDGSNAEVFEPGEGVMGSPQAPPMSARFAPDASFTTQSSSIVAAPSDSETGSPLGASTTSAAQGPAAAGHSSGTPVAVAAPRHSHEAEPLSVAAPQPLAATNTVVERAGADVAPGSGDAAAAAEAPDAPPRRAEIGADI